MHLLLYLINPQGGVEDAKHRDGRLIEVTRDEIQCCHGPASACRGATEKKALAVTIRQPFGFERSDTCGNNTTAAKVVTEGLVGCCTITHVAVRCAIANKSQVNGVKRGMIGAGIEYSTERVRRRPIGRTHEQW